MQLEAANLIKPKPTKDNYTQTTGIKVSHVSGHAISGMIRYFIPNTKGTILLCCCSVSYIQTILPVYSVPHLNAN